jgi:hypothetical protein
LPAKKSAWLARLRTAATPTTNTAKQPQEAKAIAEFSKFPAKADRPQAVAAIADAIAKGSAHRPLAWADFPEYVRNPTERIELEDLMSKVSVGETRGIAIFKTKKQLEQGPHVIRSLILARGLAGTGDHDGAKNLALRVVQTDLGRTSASQIAVRLLARIHGDTGDHVSASYCWAMVLRLDRADTEAAGEAKACFAKAGLETAATPLLALEKAGPLSSGGGNSDRLLPVLPKPNAKNDLTAKDLYRQMAASVVRITVGNGSGSGVCVGAGDIILTNHHVISGGGAIRVSVFSFGPQGLKRSFICEARRIYEDREGDLAVLKLISPSSPLTPVDVAIKEPEPGSKVFAIGSPGMGDQVLEQSITDGIVSSKAREIDGKK